MQPQPIFPRMSFKTMKLESKHLTVVPLSDIVYFFVLRSYISKVFDIGCIVFRLHQRLISESGIIIRSLLSNFIGLNDILEKTS